MRQLTPRIPLCFAWGLAWEPFLTLYRLLRQSFFGKTVRKIWSKLNFHPICKRKIEIRSERNSIGRSAHGNKTRSRSVSCFGQNPPNRPDFRFQEVYRLSEGSGPRKTAKNYSVKRERRFCINEPRLFRQPSHSIDQQHRRSHTAVPTPSSNGYGALGCGESRLLM